MSTPVEWIITNAIERASDAHHNSQYWHDEGTWDAYIAPMIAEVAAHVARERAAAVAAHHDAIVATLRSDVAALDEHGLPQAARALETIIACLPTPEATCETCAAPIPRDGRALCHECERDEGDYPPEATDARGG